LPDNYPSIRINDQGVCHFCINHKEREYLGEARLKNDIFTILQKPKHRNTSYDCVLGLSGGRDSSYLLHYLVKKLGLRILAYSVDNGFVPTQTINNMERMARILNVHLVIERHNYLESCIKHHLQSWMYKPSPAMIETFCIGCRYGMRNGILGFARKNHIPIIIRGGTPYEATFRIHLMKMNPKKRGHYQFVLGSLFNSLKNPRMLMNTQCLSFQILEYITYFDRFKTRQLFGIKPDIIEINPFKKYIQWKEKEIISTIENELEWKRNPDAQSTWRGDCEIALLKLFLYKKMLGFNDRDVNLSHLIRSGQLRRNEALNRIQHEGDIPEEIIREIFLKITLDYAQLENALSKISL
jgi:hypothetical protein